jgi:quercetin dioxygenase-like cupin family protein
MSTLNVVKSPEEWGWSKVFAKDENQALESGMFCCYPGKSLPLHTHNEADEYCYISQGSGIFVLAGKEITVSEGQLIKIPKGVEHLCRPVGNAAFESYYLVCR